MSRSLASARVDLNPHQVDAALFAIRSPFSKGVILADEVGLGKTIEAGLVIAQRWAERKRRILLILPATLRKQWQMELADKFNLPSTIMEAASYNAARRGGKLRPLEINNQILICSYHFAAAKAAEIAAVPWDLVVIDEAHRLRNVYRPDSRIARAIANAVRDRHKILLTATPLQNSLMELYGLASVVDEHVFGDQVSFREQFMQRVANERTRDNRLRERLRAICQRTLRRQVREYVRFTERIPITQDFLPSEAEHNLYERVSEYLQRDNLVALPASQRPLISLVLRKLLASSTFAIAVTLRRLVARLETMANAAQLDEEDFEEIADLREEWETDGDSEQTEPPAGPNKQAVLDELRELVTFAEMAESIGQNAKGDALLGGLKVAFEKATALGAPRKAVIFTESRRTQRYLKEMLAGNGYNGTIVLIDGSNSDPDSRGIYERWVDQHRGTPRISGSRSADTKAAIVEEFRDNATLLIATESAAEGVNLQFCSLVVNYDLPWNPQRVEQRIGRCHRYGQKHDVVVVNFVNRRNAADQRVFQLLDEKFRLFQGVFGASDEVLGVLESGVDLERRIAQVYQSCRTVEQIQAAFDALQAELDEQIRSRLSETRQSVLEHFDEEVHHRLEIHREKAMSALDQRQRWLLALTRQELGDDATFDADAPTFVYRGSLAAIGRYNINWPAAESLDATFYHSDHPLAQCLTERALTRDLPPAALHFAYRDHGARISALEPFFGHGGWLELSRLTVESVRRDEFLIFAAQADDGTPLDNDQCQKLLSIGAARVEGLAGAATPDDLLSLRENAVLGRLEEVALRNLRYLDEETEKLDRWADDLKFGLEQELKEIDREIREARRAAAAAATLAEKLEAQRRQRTLEGTRSRKRRQLFEEQDGVEHKREELIGQIEQQLEATNSVQPIMAIRWTLS